MRRPCGPFATFVFVATAMDLAMMAAAERDRGLIASLAAERSVLSEAQMMGI